MPVHIETDIFAEMNQNLVYPGSMGSGFITPGGSPVTIFLDPEFKREGQENTFHPDLAYTNDALFSQNFGSSAELKAREFAYAETRSRTKARFFELMLQSVFGDESISLKHMLVSVTSHTGDFYHDLGFVAARSREDGRRSR